MQSHSSQKKFKRNEKGLCFNCGKKGHKAKDSHTEKSEKKTDQFNQNKNVLFHW